MASLRKKYQSLDDEAPPVATGAGSDKPTPITAEPVEPKAAEPAPESNPVKEAEQSAIKQRLAEAERAQEMQRAPEPPPQAEDPDDDERMRQLVHALEAAVAPLPHEAAKQWFRLHPEYIFDDKQRARANHFHYEVMDEVGEPYTDAYFAGMERKLGLREPPPPPKPRYDPAKAAAPPASAGAGLRGPSVNVSAPPSRESPSMSSGRPLNHNSKITLSVEEREMARLSNISEEEYARQKLRMMREKGEGFHGQ